MLSAEYLDAKGKRQRACGYRARGGYAVVNWVMTGGSHVYRQGVLSDVVPRRPWGAVNVAVRYSRFCLDHGGLPGGVAQDWAVDVNGYVNSYRKLQVNDVTACSR